MKRVFYFNDTVQIIIGVVVGIIAAVVGLWIGREAEFGGFGEVLFAAVASALISGLAFLITYFTPKSTKFETTVKWALPFAILIAWIF